MKKIFLTILATVFLCLLFIVPAQSAPLVKVQGRQLLEDYNQDGIYAPYFIKGVGYQPFPIGRHPSDWGQNIFDDPEILNRDFAFLQAMNVNTIRLWKGNDTGAQFPTTLTQTTLDLAESYGIKVIAGFWIDTPGAYCYNGQLVYYPPPFINPLQEPEFTIQRTELVSAFKHYVETFKDHPAILFWAIGNENSNNIPPEYAVHWYSLINQMAREAHLSEDSAYPVGDNYHPVAIVNGDLRYIGDPAVGASDALMPHLNIWGANVYRPNASFGNLFTDFASRTAKPLWISEYGIDAFHTTAYIDGPLWFQDGYEGYEDQEEQATWDGNLWDEIVVNGNICIGGTVMAYSDEWWKPYEWAYPGSNDVQDHFGYGPQDTDCNGVPDWFPPLPDQFFNEEWFGIMSIAQNQTPYYPDDMTPREVYYTLQRRFECSGFNKYYAGPDNNKSCDGTDACCSSSAMKAKNSSCVIRCTNPCFLAGTTILMADGNLKPIEEIKIGDLVKSVDQQDKITANKVTELFVHPQTQGYLLIEASDGKQLRVTANHQVRSGNDYKPLGTLTVDSPLMFFKDGKLIETKITSIRKIETTQTVYNFEVENTHTYFADDYLVHNRKPNYYYMEAEQNR